MSIRADPAAIAGLANELQNSTREIGSAKPAPDADAGPSSAAVSAAVAELMRAAAGLAETTSRAAADLDANNATYASVEDENQGMFNRIKPP